MQRRQKRLRNAAFPIIPRSIEPIGKNSAFPPPKRRKRQARLFDPMQKQHPDVGRCAAFSVLFGADKQMDAIPADGTAAVIVAVPIADAAEQLNGRLRRKRQTCDPSGRDTVLS